MDAITGDQSAGDLHHHSGLADDHGVNQCGVGGEARAQHTAVVVHVVMPAHVLHGVSWHCERAGGVKGWLAWHGLRGGASQTGGSAACLANERSIAHHSKLPSQPLTDHGRPTLPRATTTNT